MPTLMDDPHYIGESVRVYTTEHTDPNGDAITGASPNVAATYVVYDEDGAEVTSGDLEWDATRSRWYFNHTLGPVGLYRAMLEFISTESSNPYTGVTYVRFESIVRPV